VYLVWGSTYLAIRFAIETLPPFTMAGIRFVLAGGVLYTFSRLTGAPAPRRIEWRSAVIVGACLLLGGNGLVVWAEKTVPSGIAALTVGTMPLFMAGLSGLIAREKPNFLAVVGLIVGFVGVAILVGPDLVSGASHDVSLAGVLALLTACLTWAAGSLYSRRAPLPGSALLATGMEMLAGGVLLLVVGGLRGEPAAIDLASVSARSWGALAYLFVMGSLVGFTAYIWLLRNTSTAIASTYAYVNPVVAVILGWALAGESLSPRIALAAVLVVASVFITSKAASRTRAVAAAEAAKGDRRIAQAPSRASRTPDTSAAQPER
jgi:drug/metabolite transporter (DMT)-like permease